MNADSRLLGLVALLAPRPQDLARVEGYARHVDVEVPKESEVISLPGTPEYAKETGNLILVSRPDWLTSMHDNEQVLKVIETKKYEEPVRDRSGNAAPRHKTRAKNRKKTKAAKAARKAQR